MAAYLCRDTTAGVLRAPSRHICCAATPASAATCSSFPFHCDTADKAGYVACWFNLANRLYQVLVLLLCFARESLNILRQSGVEILVERRNRGRIISGRPGLQDSPYSRHRLGSANRAAEYHHEQKQPEGKASCPLYRTACSSVFTFKVATSLTCTIGLRHFKIEQNDAIEPSSLRVDL